MPNARALLIVLDGFGIGKDSPFNAIANARKPFIKGLLEKYPHSQLLTHGEAVGLPPGVMGNSEVGHMTMGAGRVIYQDLTRISKEIREGEFFKIPLLRSTIEAGAKATGRVHFMGLLSDGGIHSHIEHLEACLTLAQELRVPEVYVHAFLDGRDSAPDSAPSFISRLLRHPIFSSSTSVAKIASIGGRFYAMDRDKRWDRVEKSWKVLTGQAPASLHSALEVIAASYADKKTDEFVEPTLLVKEGAIRDGDSLLFFNYRSDRARELTSAFVLPDFQEFPRSTVPKLSAFAGMTTYDKNLPAPVIYGPQNLHNIFGQWLEEKNLTQMRLAETEKYAHVTFFFNGGREAPFKGEDRILIPSARDVATYDLKPEMSAFEIADAAETTLVAAKHDFMLMNFANADMVGHSGNYEATVRAIEALDTCLSKVVGAAERSGYHTIITADHGNAEEMCDSRGHHNTQHTLNPVPAIWVAPNSAIAPKSARYPLRDGSLVDIMPTLCDLMNLSIPSEVTGKTLLDKK
ncbi:MAG: 2,3-bisphosphoglycerate-independent phosphoglycerate mutase [Cryobacterium sp.]|nr:2,3-bisphosphoglycerate-independent phosphoglycerate mutase [Oligoflexia bacterium]